MIFQELYLYHRQYNLQDCDMGHGTPTVLSGSCCQFLKNLIFSQCAIGHALLQSLQGVSSSNRSPDAPFHSQQKEELSKIHLEALCRALQAVKQCSTSLDMSSNAPFASNEKHKVQSKFYELLALFNIDNNQSSMWSDVKYFLVDLLKYLQLEHCILEKEAVYSALLGRDSLCLLQEFTELEYHMLSRTLATEVKNGFVSEGVEEVLTEVERVTLGLSMQVNRHQAWRQLYLMCLKQQRHFLDIIMVFHEFFVLCYMSIPVMNNNS